MCNMAKKKVKTKAEKERLQTIAEMPCYACFQDGLEVASEVHHIPGKISVHLGKKEFEKKYGTQEEILKKVNREIERCKEENQVIF